LQPQQLQTQHLQHLHQLQHHQQAVVGQPSVPAAMHSPWGVMVSACGQQQGYYMAASQPGASFCACTQGVAQESQFGDAARNNSWEQAPMPLVGPLWGAPHGPMLWRPSPSSSTAAAGYSRASAAGDCHDADNIFVENCPLWPFQKRKSR
jgi:hypothetical protein